MVADVSEEQIEIALTLAEEVLTALLISFAISYVFYWVYK